MCNYHAQSNFTHLKRRARTLSSNNIQSFATATTLHPSIFRTCFSCLRSSALSAGLGWALPLRGSVLAQQLLHLGQLHATVPDANVAKHLAGLVPQLYRVISDLQNNDDLQMACATLHGTACVWVGNGFASAGKVSFKVC